MIRVSRDIGRKYRKGLQNSDSSIVWCNQVTSTRVNKVGVIFNAYYPF
jgi:hypothetical protein